MSDQHKYPFSLFAAAKQSPKTCSIDKSGGVYLDVYDKSIGRSVLQVRGSVSANNFIEYSDLSLMGSFLYIMMKLHKNEVGTFHIEISTTEGLTIRVTFSTLYDGVRFLGRSLRIPLVRSEHNWRILALDMHSILSTYCLNPNSTQKYTFEEIKVMNDTYYAFDVGVSLIVIRKFKYAPILRSKIA